MDRSIRGSVVGGGIVERWTWWRPFRVVTASSKALVFDVLDCCGRAGRRQGSNVLVSWRWSQVKVAWKAWVGYDIGLKSGSIHWNGLSGET